MPFVALCNHKADHLRKLLAPDSKEVLCCYGGNTGGWGHITADTGGGGVGEASKQRAVGLGTQTRSMLCIAARQVSCVCGSYNSYPW